MTRLTVKDLDRAANDDRWLGWGYLGERSHQTTKRIREATDRRVIKHANDAGWTYEDLFSWCNSKPGRWLGDVIFGGTGTFGERWEHAVRAHLLDLPVD